MSWRRVMRRPSTLVALAALLLVAVVWGVGAASAAQPQTLDQRTYAVASQLQCPICDGESVAASSSTLATQMRGVIRQQLAAGKSEQQVLTYFQQSYGDSILESPPKQGFTTLIWIMPLLMLLAGLWLVFSLGREWRADRAAPVVTPAWETEDGEMVELTPDEQRRLAAILQRELAADEGLPAQTRTEGR